MLRHDDGSPVKFEWDDGTPLSWYDVAIMLVIVIGMGYIAIM